MNCDTEELLTEHNDITTMNVVYSCHCSKLFNSEELLKKHLEVEKCIPQSQMQEDSVDESEVINIASERDDFFITTEDGKEGLKLSDLRQLVDIECVVNNASNNDAVSSVKVDKFKNKCKHCRKRYFNTIEELELHQNCHTTLSSYKCPLCFIKCTAWKNMLAHLSSHPEYFQMYGHLKFMSGTYGLYTCDICNKSFPKKSYLSNHIMKVHNKTDKICEKCGTTMKQCGDKTFKRHTEKCGSHEYICSHLDESQSKVCGYKTKVEADFKRHTKVHQGLGFSCIHCAKVFPTKQRLLTHSKTHDKNREQYPCPDCNNTFLSGESLNRHKIRQHWEPSSEAELHHCNICGYFSKLKHDLTKHLQIHNKRLQCTLCDYNTNSENALENHQSYHEPQKKHRCTYPDCYYACYNTTQLKSHVHRVHLAENKHQCPICKAMFRLRTNLARHIVTHSEGLAYCCLECGEGFRTHAMYYKHRKQTGHDRKRDGVVSVPQNIKIMYVNGKNKLDVDFNDIVKNFTISKQSASNIDINDDIKSKEEYTDEERVLTKFNDISTFGEEVVVCEESVETCDGILVSHDVVQSSEICTI